MQQQLCRKQRNIEKKNSKKITPEQYLIFVSKVKLKFIFLQIEGLDD